MNIDIQTSRLGQRVFKDFTTKWTQLFLKELEKEKNLKNKNLLKCSELSLVYVEGKVIRRLNKEYRKKDKATDVLSFSGDGFVSLGEILLCQKELKKKSDKSNLNLKLFSQLMICHSVLHLLGYTHEDSLASEREMLLIQNKVLKRVATKMAAKYKNEFEILIQS